MFQRVLPRKEFYRIGEYSKLIRRSGGLEAILWMLALEADEQQRQKDSNDFSYQVAVKVLLSYGESEVVKMPAAVFFRLGSPLKEVQQIFENNVSLDRALDLIRSNKQMSEFDPEYYDKLREIRSTVVDQCCNEQPNSDKEAAELIKTLSRAQDIEFEFPEADVDDEMSSHFHTSQWQLEVTKLGFAIGSSLYFDVSDEALKEIATLTSAYSDLYTALLVNQAKLLELTKRSFPLLFDAIGEHQKHRIFAREHFLAAMYKAIWSLSSSECHPLSTENKNESVNDMCF